MNKMITVLYQLSQVLQQFVFSKGDLESLCNCLKGVSWWSMSACCLYLLFISGNWRLSILTLPPQLCTVSCALPSDMLVVSESNCRLDSSFHSRGNFPAFTKISACKESCGRKGTTCHHGYRSQKDLLHILHCSVHYVFHVCQVLFIQKEFKFLEGSDRILALFFEYQKESSDYS